MPQTDFYLVREGEGAALELVGAGEEGELLIGGVGVAAGYIHAQDLTSQVRF